MHFKDVFTFLQERQALGRATVLVTVGSVQGSSMRNPGAIMGVADDGSFAGSLSGGCIENAVVAEALEVMSTGTPRVVRFGAGSPYLDIKLPCGGGLDLHFQPLGESGLATECLASIAQREPFSIALSPGGAVHRPFWQETVFETQSGEGAFGHWPAAQLRIVGHGAGVEALCHLASAMECDTHVLTPDEAIVAALNDQGFAADRIARTSQTELLQSDPWTAFVFLFHDHDWEIDLIARALELPHFYLGAMGGRKAHAMRSDALVAKGVSPEDIACIRAPIGVFHSSRDPQTLALSTLAEIIRVYQETDFEALCAGQ